MNKRWTAFRLSSIARILFSGILFSMPVLWGACRNNTQEVNRILSGTSSLMQEDKATDVTLYYSDRAKVKAILKAKEFIRNETASAPYTDIKKGLKVEFLDDSLRVESTLTALSARIFENEGNVIVRDSVRVVDKKGQVLETEELVWNQKLDKFYTDKKVVISSPTQVMYGDGLEANADFSWYKIRNLKGIVAVEKKGLPD